MSLKSTQHVGVKHTCFTPTCWGKAYMLYPYRTARSNCHHRYSGGNIASVTSAGTVKFQTVGLCIQFETDRSRRSDVR